MKRKFMPVTLLFVAIPLLLLAACGGSTGSSGTTTTPTTAPTSTPAATTATATLAHVPSGMATLSWDSTTKVLTVKVTLSGLAPSSIHPGHIHTGSCASQGNVLYPLTSLKADATGNGSATTTIPNVMEGIPATGWYVNVHNGPALAPDTQFLPIVCADVANSNTSTTAAQSVQVPMTSAPSASAGETVSGKAQLTLSGTTLTVVVTVSGLAPNSSHTNHIHQGSCASQGNVVYPLTTLKADASGAATATTTIPNVKSIPASGWYVNIHNSTDLTTQTGFDPVACGDVTAG